MNKQKHNLALVCAALGLLQLEPPPANAQAAALGQQLTNMGLQMLPVVIPMAISAIPLVIRAAPAIPALIKENVPHPHIPFVGRKAQPAAEETAAQPPVAPEGMQEAAAPAEAAEEIAVPRQAATYVEESVSTQLKTDNSEWFLEEDTHHKPVSISSRPLAAPRSAGRAKQEQASELKASPLALPTAQNALNPPTSWANDTPRPDSARRSKEVIQAAPPADAVPAAREESLPPTIMMKVAE